MKTVYHLRPADLTPTAYCGMECNPEHTVDRWEKIPDNGRPCRRCVRRFFRLGLTARVSEARANGLVGRILK